MISQESLQYQGFDVTQEQANKIKEHYENPKNNSALENYNARGIGKNPDNWGQVDMTLEIDNDGILQNIGYEYKGCPTIAFTASVFTEELKGISIDEAIKSTNLELEAMMAQTNCDDCIKMILVAFIAAYENYHDRSNNINNDHKIKMIDTTVPYTQQSCEK